MPNKKKIGFLIKQVFYLHEQHLNKQFSKFGLTAYTDIYIKFICLNLTTKELV